MTNVDRIQGLSGSLAVKVPCRVATTGNITLSGLQTIDTVAVVAGDRVLVKDQTDATENGIWIASTSEWSRALDFNGRNDFVQGTLIGVLSGATDPGTLWQLNTASPSIGSALSFGRYNASVSQLRADLAAQTGSGIVGHVAAGAGATPRTVQDKLHESVSVKDFGAVGEGVTDATAAIQEALDYIKVNDLTLDLAGGTYLISSPLEINNGDCGITNGKLVADAGFTADGTGSLAMLRLNTGLRINVTDIHFECNFVANGIHCESGGFNNFYSHLEIIEGKDFGMKLEGNGDQRVADCMITQYQSDGDLRTGIGLWIPNADCKVQNCTIRYWAKCLVLNGSTNLITDCHVYNGNPAGMVNPLTNSVNIEITEDGNTIANCYIDKGRIVLSGGGFNSHFIGNRYLFTTVAPEHDSVFLFDAVDTVSKTWPTSVLHTGNYGTLPVTNSTIPFVELTASGSGSWATSAQNMAADLQTYGAMFANEGEKVKVVQINLNRYVLYESNVERIVHRLAGATYNVAQGMLANGESTTEANALRHRYSSNGSLTTATLIVEGSRTGVSAVSNLRLADRRGVSTKGLDDTALGYIDIRSLGNTSTNPNALSFYISPPASATETEYLQLFTTYLRPGPDNAMTLGDATHRWSVVYAGTGTINTSDEREKQDIADLDAAEKRVAVAVKGLVKKFRFRDAVAEKGDSARIHFGVIAQEVMAAFQAEGLDPMRYGVICYDEWDDQYKDVIVKETVFDEEGNELEPEITEQVLDIRAGNRYGVRYEELLAFIIAGL